ncbi:RICIN domain-containing protein [Streptomyces sp. NPDC001292]|uniref:RICIN domain-containing protein n=1 Tax=Streptomyces sp. NPDC001292 TaxID=3364558 RepID=UPI00369D3424
MRIVKQGDKNGILSHRPVRRAAGLAGALITAVFSLGAAGASTAQAATQDSVQTFRNQETGRCVATLYAPWAYAGSCDGRTETKWNVHQWTDGTRELRSLQTGQCLEDTDIVFHNARVNTCHGTRVQSWYVHRWKDGTIELKNQETGRCLDDSFAFGLRTYPCNASRFQSWY